MTYTFQMVGEPNLSHFFNIKDKIYSELVHRLLLYGKKYVPHYFIRGMTEFLLKKYSDKELVGIEIGTGVGGNAIAMLSVLPIKKLYCIDPYTTYIEDKFGQKEKKKVEECLETAKKNLAKYSKKVSFIEEYSDKAINRFEDNSLDFVYIDGNHSYDFVKRDIELYYPKVRSGGVLGGHDFGSGYVGVVYAVLEFIRDNNFKLATGRDSDWWIVKNNK